MRFLVSWFNHYAPHALRLAKHMSKKTGRFIRRHFKAIMVWGIGAGFLLAGAFVLWAATLQIPDLASLSERQVRQSVKIFDRTGTVMLYDLQKEERRTIVPLEEISPALRNAVVAVEDAHFYEHKGLRPTSILRAIITNLLAANPLGGQGGSTITQQVVKGSLLVNDKTIARKFKEWVLALKLEKVLTKNQILELYLNQSPFGGQLYGVEEASQTFFGKHASDITVPEAAYIAGVLPAPTRLSPYRTDDSGKNTRLETRKNLTLEKMLEHGYLNEAEYEEAKKAEVAFLPPRESSIAAPHFVFYVQQYLENKYGSDALEESGWRIITTLDADLQIKAEEVVQRKALENEVNFNAENAALIALDPQNGQILSMVGSRNYFDTEIDGAYNVTTSLPGRQPGSAFKPFAYAEAFIKGYTPETVVFDVRTQFSTACQPTEMNNENPCYSPVNYDGLFRGPMTLRNALAQSINVPAVKTLYLAGLTDTLRLAKAMGISTLGDPGRYGLTLVLGGGEVTLLDMTSAYGVFATDGMRVPPISVLRVEEANGTVIEDNERNQGSQVLQRDAAQKINDILSDTAAREPLTGGSALFNFSGRDVALKTGTTNDYRDAWTIGYTPNLVVGAWAGNNDNSSMEHRVSGFIVGPIWSEVMKYAIARRPDTAFTRDETGTEQLKPVLRGIWQGNEIQNQNGIEYVKQEVHDILHWVDKSNPNGPLPSNPQGDSQYTLWEVPVRVWAQTNGYNDGATVPVGSTQNQN
ncbi:MAG: transglycosylase domain-containing protein [Candidatus Pacebacteria bacterium]|nr:transglycosylase domain-containing protein [Candidatus Paceibacterota bacterium]